MTSYLKSLAAIAAIAGVAAPAAAQYQQPYPNTYSQQGYPQQGYPQQYSQPYQNYGGNQAYGYNQNYSQNPVGAIIDSLLGNRYTVTDRQAVSQCASAALAQAQYQYRGYGQRDNGVYRQGYGYNQNIAAPALRVTSITDVQRRSSGLRVKGTIGTGYGGQYGYQNRGYGDLSFRCNVDYRGSVTGLRVSPDNTRRY
jgi:hypothetical protein